LFVGLSLRGFLAAFFGLPSLIGAAFRFYSDDTMGFQKGTCVAVSTGTGLTHIHTHLVAMVIVFSVVHLHVILIYIHGIVVVAILRPFHA
jgi:hypothetical protein